MKKLLCALTLLVLACALVTSCLGESPALSQIGEAFWEVGPYTSLEEDFVDEYFAQTNDNWGGGCSAISAVIEGRRLVGRNMDLNISNKCAYVVRTQVPGKYETLGLAYTFRSVSPDEEELKVSGLGETFEKILPFMCDDVLNSEGLHIEINMRHGEQDQEGNDLFGVEHTNPDAAQRVYVFTLGQYIALNCRNLTEAREYLAREVDVYSQKNYWNYAYILTDGEGNSALLEFGNGTYYWTEPGEDGIIAQTNFYINEECRAREAILTGLGRYDALLEGIQTVTTKADLFALMKKVQFSSYYLPYQECKENHFDPRSEVIGEENDLGLDLTYEFVMDPENEELISYALTAQAEYLLSLTRQEKQDANYYWESTFTEIVDPAERVIEVRLFEDDTRLYRITFEGVEEIAEIQ